MANFVKITTRIETGYLRQWVRSENISSVVQESTQGGDNEGTIIMVDGTEIKAIDLNATLEMLG